MSPSFALAYDREDDGFLTVPLLSFSVLHFSVFLLPDLRIVRFSCNVKVETDRITSDTDTAMTMIMMMLFVVL